MITIDDVLSNFIYKAETGELLFKNWWRGRPPGGVAGRPNEKGYLRVRLKGKTYKVHRLIWLLETGAFPTYEIDHIDGNKQNNHISNLRDVPSYMNQQNRKSAKGYYKTPNGYRVDVYIKGVKMYIGTYATTEEAREAYLSTKVKHYEGHIPQGA